MRVNLKGSVTNAASVLEVCHAELKKLMPKNVFDEFCMNYQPLLHAGNLREIAENVESVTNGTHSLIEFGKFYRIIHDER